MKTLGEAADEFARAISSQTSTSYSFDRNAFIKGAEWMRNQFTLHGTDDCRDSDCRTGRCTLYSTLDGYCVECAHKREKLKP